MESHPYPHLGLTVHLALFTSLPGPSASALLQRLIHASTLPATPAGDAARAAVNFAFVDAALVTGRLALLTAAYQACLAEWEGTMRTRTVHSEVLWCLSPGSNITDALRRFGLSASTQSLIVLHICPIAPPSASTSASDPHQPANVEARMRAAVPGQLASLDTLGEQTDWRAVRKVYKLSSDPALLLIQKSDLSGGEKEMELRRTTDGTVVSLVAMKSVAA